MNLGLGLLGPIVAQIVAFLLQLLNRRIGAAREMASSPAVQSALADADTRYVRRESKKIARSIVQAFPDLNLSCVETALPPFLHKLADLVAEQGNVLENPKRLIGLVVGFITDVVNCQLGLTAQAATDLKGKILECAVAAGTKFVLGGFKDPAAAISAFITCVLGSAGGGGDDGGTGGGGGGETPSGFNPAPLNPCGGGQNVAQEAPQGLT